tara:strand:- start:1233 stop:1634 length:402 start_codon:yes stop_codon:yes gene_type:complete
VRSILSKQFSIFLVAGAIAACVNFFSRVVLSQWLSFSYAIFIAYLFGMITAFLLNKLYVFTTTNVNSATSAIRFIFVNVLAVAQTWMISFGLVEFVFPGFGLINYSQEIAHAIGITVPVLTSYFGHKYWTFKH